MLIYLLLNFCFTLELEDLVEFEAPVFEIADVVYLCVVAIEHVLDTCLQLIELHLEVASLLGQLLVAQYQILLGRLYLVLLLRYRLKQLVLQQLGHAGGIDDNVLFFFLYEFLHLPELASQTVQLSPQLPLGDVVFLVEGSHV